MAVYDEDIWPQPSITEKVPADPKDRVGFTDFINSGRVNYPSVVGKVYEQTNKEFGTDVPAPE
jgi:ribonuclease Z